MSSLSGNGLIVKLLEQIITLTQEGNQINEDIIALRQSNAELQEARYRSLLDRVAVLETAVLH